MLSTKIQSQLKGKRIFLTGGTGIFGKWLLQAFRDLDVELVLLSRNPESFKQAFPETEQMKVSFVQGDVRTFDFPSGSFDYIFHAATPVVSDDLSDDADELISVISDGTERVLTLASSRLTGRLLYISSGAVYGIQPPELERIPETHPANPVSAYGRGKLAAEKRCLESGLDCVIARCFAFVGPYMPLNEQFAIGNFIGNCLRGETINIKGDGTPVRSYMFATDLVEWLMTIVLEGTVGDVYNVGSEVPVSITELAECVRSEIGSENQISIKTKAEPGILPARYVPSVDKAEAQLKLRRTVDLSEAVQRTVHVLKERYD